MALHKKVLTKNRGKRASQSLLSGGSWKCLGLGSVRRRISFVNSNGKP